MPRWASVLAEKLNGWQYRIYCAADIDSECGADILLRLLACPDPGVGEDALERCDCVAFADPFAYCARVADVEHFGVNHSATISACLSD